MSGSRSGRVYGAAPRGLFVNGNWQCDCEPRLPAAHFETKKEGPNKGRWFYSCQKRPGEPGRCKFFLWDDDAKPRERDALLNNSRSEAEARTTAPANPTPQRASSPPPPYTIQATGSEASRKRSRPDADDQDDYGLGPGEAAFEHELDRARIETETPRKAQRVESYTTPRRRLPWESHTNGLPTPQTERLDRNDPFATRLAYPGGSLLTPSRFAQPDEEAASCSTPSSSFDTPTPSRFRDAGVAQAENSLTTGVFKLLKDENVHLSAQVEIALRNLLAKHAEGKRRSQDLLRKQIQAKEAKITELNHRNNSLQAELEVEKSKVHYLQLEDDVGLDP